MIKFKIRNEFFIFAVLGALLLALIAVGVEGLPALLVAIRLLLGLIFVLYVPGYALQAALFPRRDDLDGPERLALSLGLSVAIVPAVALLLDQLPGGIRLWPIVLSETVVIAASLLAAWLRRRRLPLEERPLAEIELDLWSWWGAQERTNRILYGILAGALALALIAATAILALPRSVDSFTEFYVLGPEGLAENYPRESLANDPVSITAGIANQEGRPLTYRIEIQTAGALLAEVGPIDLEHGEVWEAAVTYTLPEAGDDQAVDFFLYREDDNAPHRSLRLWIDVNAAD
ncbi:MAG: DUF1616 domain-containing protein [Anaerolineae bacterium]|nr:DUF1616 domain-containing protein [Anaerolineae bacterium]